MEVEAPKGRVYILEASSEVDFESSTCGNYEGSLQRGVCIIFLESMIWPMQTKAGMPVRLKSSDCYGCKCCN